MFSKKQIIISILVILLLLCIIGLTFVSSITQPISEYTKGNKFGYLNVYVAYMIIGLISGYITFRFLTTKIFRNNFKNYLKVAIVAYLILILLLIVTVASGVSVHGATRWIRLGPINIQPSEFAKPVMIFTLSTFIYQKEKQRDINNLAILWVVAVGICVGCIFIQKSNTSALQVAILCYLMLCVSKVTETSKFLLAGVGGICAILLIITKKGYALRRITQWADKDVGQGVQVRAALEAIKTGGIFGRGIGNGFQKYFYLPEAHNDYVFASICEEGGLIFGLLVIILFIALFLILFYQAASMEHSIFKYIVYGVNFSIVNQAILNMLINLNIMPSTGITLPFISYGGSSFVANSISMGLLFAAIKNYNNAKKGN